MVNFFNKNTDDKPKVKYKFKLKLPEWFDEKGIEYRETSTGEVIVETCPSCGKNRKLYVEPETGVAQCKYADCELTNGISPVKMVEVLLGVSTSEAIKIALEVKQKKKSTSIFDEDEDEEDEEKEDKDSFRKKVRQETETITMPSDTVLLTKSFDRAWNYLIKRGYTDELIEKLELHVMPFSDYKDAWAALQKKGYSVDEIKFNLRYLNRIFFPVKYKGELKGFVARDFSNKVDPAFKALNSVGQFRAKYVWNFDNVKDSDTVVLCEGITDAIKCGINRAIAFFGAAATEDQLELIKTTKAQKIVLCLDVGTEKSQNHIYEQLLTSYPGQIYVVDLPSLLTQKESLLNENIKKAFEEVIGDEIEYFKENELIIDYHKYQKIKKLFKEKWFKLSSKDYESLGFFIENAQFKDAGDYSFQEMDNFIKNAKIFQLKEIPSKD